MWKEGPACLKIKLPGVTTLNPPQAKKVGTNCSVSLFWDVFPLRDKDEVEIACRPTWSHVRPHRNDSYSPVFLLPCEVRYLCEAKVWRPDSAFYSLCDCSNWRTRHNSRRSVSPKNVAHSGTKHETHNQHASLHWSENKMIWTANQSSCSNFPWCVYSCLLPWLAANK